MHGIFRLNARLKIGARIGIGFGILIVIVYDVIVSLILLKVIDIVIGLRVSPEIEQEGLDLALHGETVQ